MRYLFVILLMLLSCTTRAQTNNVYETDINALYSILQKTPSYKDQIKGQALVSYTELFKKLKAETVHNPSDYLYFYNLAQLFFPIRDNHLGFYQIIDDNDFKDQASYEKFMTTKEFKDFPKLAINIDSLKDALSTKPRDSIEGI